MNLPDHDRNKPAARVTMKEIAGLIRRAISTDIPLRSKDVWLNDIVSR